MVGKLSSILNPVTFLVMNLGVCAILWVGGIQVNVGDLTQGQVMAFVNYMTQTLTSIVYVANLVVVFTKASASASLVSGTIRSNLTWRNEAATDEELWAALDMAQASEFVRNKPQGLDAPVEAGGKNFSGGQRQRLTIARALVGSPQVLIMDDSASALDFKTDAALRHAVRERSVRGAAEGGLPLTTVIVSQRVSTVRDADMICVLDHGSVAGLGTHDELYASCQLYREICQSQLRREELEGQQGSAAPASAPTVPASVCAKEGC